MKALEIFRTVGAAQRCRIVCATGAPALKSLEWLPRTVTFPRSEDNTQHTHTQTDTVWAQWNPCKQPLLSSHLPCSVSGEMSTDTEALQCDNAALRSFFRCEKTSGLTNCLPVKTHVQQQSAVACVAVQSHLNIKGLSGCGGIGWSHGRGGFRILSPAQDGLETTALTGTPKVLSSCVVSATTLSVTALHLARSLASIRFTHLASRLQVKLCQSLHMTFTDLICSRSATNGLHFHILTSSRRHVREVRNLRRTSTVCQVCSLARCRGAPGQTIGENPISVRTCKDGRVLEMM